MPTVTFVDCATVALLHRIAAGDHAADADLAGAATSALAIIRDAHASPMDHRDLDFLRDLVDELNREGHLAIFEHLKHDAPDCRVCAALALRLMDLPLDPPKPS